MTEIYRHLDIYYEGNDHAYDIAGEHGPEAVSALRELLADRFEEAYREGQDEFEAQWNISLGFDSLEPGTRSVVTDDAEAPDDQFVRTALNDLMDEVASNLTDADIAECIAD